MKNIQVEVKDGKAKIGLDKDFTNNELILAWWGITKRIFENSNSENAKNEMIKLINLLEAKHGQNKL